MENIMGKDDWLSIQHESLDDIESVSNALEHMSRDFYSVGNEKMGKHLHVCAKSLELNTERMRKANSNHTRLLVKQAHQTTGIMLNAFLVGKEISEASKNPEKMDDLRKEVQENMQKYSR
jgi:hypothetical protein